MSDEAEEHCVTCGRLFRTVQRHAPLRCPECLVCDLLAERARLRALLAGVHGAGRPHSHLCGCDQCAAFEAVRKELRGE